MKFVVKQGKHRHDILSIFSVHATKVTNLDTRLEMLCNLGTRSEIFKTRLQQLETRYESFDSHGTSYGRRQQGRVRKTVTKAREVGIFQVKGLIRK